MRVRSLLLPLLLLLLCPMLAEGQIRQISSAPFTGGVLTSTITIPAGSGTATYKPVGVIERKYTSTGTTNVTTEETLWTYTLPANTLNADGQSIRITGTITYAANANTKTAQLWAGAVNRGLNPSTGGPNGVSHSFQWILQRTGAAAQRFYPVTSTVGSVAQAINATTAALDTTGTIVIKITGTNGTASANDIVLHSVLVEYLP